jgi:hypothetical protein
VIQFHVLVDINPTNTVIFLTVPGLKSIKTQYTQHRKPDNTFFVKETVIILLEFPAVNREKTSSETYFVQTYEG